jgi:hypothetical protein
LWDEGTGNAWEGTEERKASLGSARFEECASGEWERLSQARVDILSPLKPITIRNMQMAVKRTYS